MPTNSKKKSSKKEYIVLFDPTSPKLKRILLILGIIIVIPIFMYLIWGSRIFSLIPFFPSPTVSKEVTVKLLNDKPKNAISLYIPKEALRNPYVDYSRAESQLIGFTIYLSTEDFKTILKDYYSITYDHPELVDVLNAANGPLDATSYIKDQQLLERFTISAFKMNQICLIPDGEATCTPNIIDYLYESSCSWKSRCGYSENGWKLPDGRKLFKDVFMAI